MPFIGVFAIVAGAVAALVSIVAVAFDWLRERKSPKKRVVFKTDESEVEYYISPEQAQKVRKILETDDREMRRATS